MKSKIIQSWAWGRTRINLQTSQNMLNILQIGKLDFASIYIICTVGENTDFLLGGGRGVCDCFSINRKVSLFNELL